MHKLFSLLCLWSLFLFIGVHVKANELEGFWKYSDKTINEITAYTLEARNKGKKSGDRAKAEIAEAYRNHMRQFSMNEDGQVHLRLIQFEQNADEYSEYYRDFYLDYRSNENGFSIWNGDKEIFSGQIISGKLQLTDADSGKVLEMVRVSDNDVPVITENNFSQPKLDRKPKARKLANPEYPPVLEQKGISGIVKISFFVNTDGSTSEVKIISSPHPGLEKAALDAILESTFRPGMVDGKPVRTHVKLPITFR